jgi:hypothetical protein
MGAQISSRGRGFAMGNAPGRDGARTQIRLVGDAGLETAATGDGAAAREVGAHPCGASWTSRRSAQRLGVEASAVFVDAQRRALRLEVDVSIGPVELLVLKFPDERISRPLSASLQDLVNSGLIRVIDIVFAKKSTDDGVQVTEFHELEDDEYAALDGVIEEVAGLINNDDVDRLTGSMEPGSSAAIMLFEHSWAKRFADEVTAAHGEVVLAERIPRVVIDELMRSRDEQLVAAT